MQNILQPLVFPFPFLHQTAAGRSLFYEKGAPCFFGHNNLAALTPTYFSAPLFSCSFTKLLICSNA